MTATEFAIYKKEVEAAYPDKTCEEYRRLNKEIWCREMVNSILCYGGFGKTATQVYEAEEKSPHNYLKDYVDVLGKVRVMEIIKEQIESIVDIRHCVYEDNEGCSYNSIIWKEPLVESFESFINKSVSARVSCPKCGHVLYDCLWHEYTDDKDKFNKKAELRETCMLHSPAICPVCGLELK